MPMPDRTLQLVLKLKASWDRGYRLMNGTSHDQEWGGGKLVKDKGDVIALLDPAYGGRDVRLDALDDYLKKWPFLKDCIFQALEDPEALDIYRKLDREDAGDLVVRLRGSLR